MMPEDNGVNMQPSVQQSRVDAKVVEINGKTVVLIGFVNPRRTADGIPCVPMSVEQYAEMTAGLAAHAQAVLKKWQEDEPVRRARAAGLTVPDGGVQPVVRGKA